MQSESSFDNPTFDSPGDLDMSTATAPAPQPTTDPVPPPPTPFTTIFRHLQGCNIGFAVQRHKDMCWYDFKQGVFSPNPPSQDALFSLAIPQKTFPMSYVASIPNANLAVFTDGYYFIYWCLTRESNQLLDTTTVYVKDGTDVPH